MSKILDEISLVAALGCKNHSCPNHTKTLDFVCMVATEREAIYDEYLDGELEVCQEPCDHCKSHLQLHPPTAAFFHSEVGGKKYLINFKFSSDDVARLIDFWKNVTEENWRGKKVFPATSEAYKFDHLYEVYPSGLFISTVTSPNDGYEAFPQASPIENFNKVLIITRKGVSLSSDVKIDGGVATVAIRPLTLPDMIAVSTLMKQIVKCDNSNLTFYDEELEQELE